MNDCAESRNLFLKRHRGFSMLAAWSTRELTVEERDNLPCPFVLEHPFFHEPVRVQDSAVITAAKRFADFVERGLRQHTREVHGDLPWESDVRRAALAGHVREPHVEMLRHAALELVDGNRPARLLAEAVL